MGLLVEGKWHTDWYDTASSNGRFVRKAAQFNHWVTADGQPGPTGQGGFKAEAGRYHLYVSLACPWAHRTLIFRALKGLEEMISVSIVNSYMADEGWTFEPGPGVVPDSVNGKTRMHEIYTLAKGDYTGRVTVPVLWDKHQQTIVSNESADIIRMLNSAFDHLGAKPGDYYPEGKRDEIDAINERVYHGFNNGVYRAGFATTQAAYDEAVVDVFNVLDELEHKLTTQRYLAGEQLTEADWRLFTTLVRFDAVYVGHFKCNLKRIADYPVLSNYLRELYQYPGVAPTVDIDYIKAHYYASHETINPTRIIPAGPELNFDAPHNRDQLKSAQTVSGAAS
ncbi:glutathione S-transferase family protein [Thalassomonas actiniarum]|uniref:Glutathione S-transferase family protein n=1 Tax=Thalassomonas actiniarum TaxID=485447 RepID=A0AAE9YPM7_9GAMM|nr:glutathione S-transferase family protein [Thalassomonas actiniarum]WDD97232.1 glutathione S-transferase family protein [Thalassomonas actiniarum]